MTAEMSDSLRRVERGLETLERIPLRSLLRPGIPPEQVREGLARVGLPSTPDFEALYGWRDGTNAGQGVPLDDLHLFPGFYLLSLEDSLANYRAFASDSRWTSGWLPVFANGGGDFYIVDMSGPALGHVRHFRIDEAEHPVEFNSLAAMIETVAAGFDRGLFFVDSDGYLEMDDLAFATVAARINPDVAWWRD